MGARIPKAFLNHQERAVQSFVRMTKKVIGFAHIPGDGYTSNTGLQLSSSGLQHHLEESMGLHGPIDGVAAHQTITDGQGPANNVRKLHVGQPLPGRPVMYGGYVHSNDGTSRSMSQPWRNAGYGICKKAVCMGKTGLCHSQLATLQQEPNAWAKVSQWVESLTHEVMQDPLQVSVVFFGLELLRDTGKEPIRPKTFD